MRAFSLGQPSRGLDQAQMLQPEVGHGARHHADVVGELRAHQDHHRRFPHADRRGPGLARAAQPMAQLADDAARPEPVLLAGPGLGEMLEARRRQGTGARAAQPDRGILERDLRMARDELVERLDTELLHAQPAAGTGCIVRLAAALRAVGEDRLQARAIETRNGQLREPHIDRLLVAGMHDGRDREPAADHGRLSILDRDVGHFRSLLGINHDGGHSEVI